MTMHKSICFSGHRIEKLKCPIETIQDKLTAAIDKAISDGFTMFYHGCCTGVDLIAAELVLQRKLQTFKEKIQPISLIGVVPHEEQAVGWSEEWRNKYYEVLAKCDDVITLNTKYKSGCYYERNRYMVDRSHRLIAVYDGKSSGGTKQTIAYAQAKGIEIKTILI